VTKVPITLDRPPQGDLGRHHGERCGSRLPEQHRRRRAGGRLGRPGRQPEAKESGGDSGSVAQIGKTPIRLIRLLIGGKSRNVYLKLEGDNPGGSIKYRTALSLLRSLEKTGRLSADVRLVESSSGNLAVGLAMLARDSGYRFTAVLDPKVTAENKHRLHELGAETTMVETPDETGGVGCPGHGDPGETTSSAVGPD
jgi:hypothetical protein